eukprot:2971491-Pleurochrysis_carterae.AAC.1
MIACVVCCARSTVARMRVCEHASPRARCARAPQALAHCLLCTLGAPLSRRPLLPLSPPAPPPCSPPPPSYLQDAVAT